MGFLKLVKSDLARLDKPTFFNYLKWYYFPKGSTFRFDVWIRFMHSIRAHAFIKYTIGIPFYFWYRHLELKYGIFVDPSIEIGPGLRIVHCSGVFLNCTSIGSNFTVYQNVTIGSNGLDNSVPTVRDNVTIYTGSIVAGGIVLEDNCIIACNSFVNKSVPCNTMVAGCPAKHVKNRG